MCDLLYQSAVAYAALLDKRYHITIARKCKLKVLKLTFPEHAYFHLAGLHYAGIAQLANGKNALQYVLSGSITGEQLQASGVMSLVQDRLQSIVMLQKLLEGGHIVFRYREHRPVWSDIQADYIACFELESDAVLYFTAGNTDEEQQPVSIFRRSDRSYTEYCPRYKVLKIERESTEKSVVEEVFCSPSFRK